MQIGDVVRVRGEETTGPVVEVQETRVAILVAPLTRCWYPPEMLEPAA